MKINGKGFVKAIVLNLVLVGTLVGGISAYSDQNFGMYSSDEKVLAYAEKLNCDMSYVKRRNDNFIRMRHNGDEPIYVGIDSSYTETEVEAVKLALDEVFSIIGTINSKYRYEIVTEEEFDSIRGKTTIYFTSKTNMQLPNADAEIESRLSLISQIIDKKLENKFEISLNEKERENCTLQRLVEIFKHELGHAFSFDDVYERKNGIAVYNSNKTNTFMNSLIDDMLGTFTPNDVKCWIALYAEDSYKVQFLENIFLAKYTEEYYNRFTAKAIKKVHGVEEFDYSSFDFESRFNVNEIDKKFGYIYQISVSNNRYSFAIIDRDSGKLLDMCTGEVYKSNGVLVLRDVKLEKGVNPSSAFESYENGSAQDLVVGKLKNEIGGNSYFFYDIFTNWKSIGNVVDLEKSID